MVILTRYNMYISFFGQFLSINFLYHMLSKYVHHIAYYGYFLSFFIVHINFKFLFYCHDLKI